MIEFINTNPWSEALGWTLVHSLWQGALLAGIVLALIHLLGSTPRRRYHLLLLGLAAFWVGVCATFWWLLPESIAATETSITHFAEANLATSAHATPEMNWQSWIPLIAIFWALGAAGFSLRWLVDCGYLLYLRHSAIPLNGKWSGQLRALSQRLKSTRIPVLAEHPAVVAPMMTGVFRPLILLPVGLVNQLSTAEVEAILIHELAHLKRNDLLINVLQTTTEIIFYYHPFIWWLNAKIRFERELCCDEIALQQFHSPADYARTLVRISEFQQTRLTVAFANKHSLLNRIHFILKQPLSKSTLMEKLSVSGAFLTGLLIWSLWTPSFAEKAVINNSLDVIQQMNPQDSLPNKKQALDVEIVDGKIQFIQIDGKTIAPEEYEQYGILIDENGAVNVRDDHQYSMSIVQSGSGNSVRVHQSDGSDYAFSDRDEDISHMTRTDSLGNRTEQYYRTQKGDPESGQRVRREKIDPPTDTRFQKDASKTAPRSSNRFEEVSEQKSTATNQAERNYPQRQNEAENDVIAQLAEMERELETRLRAAGLDEATIQESTSGIRKQMEMQEQIQAQRREREQTIDRRSSEVQAEMLERRQEQLQAEQERLQAEQERLAAEQEQIEAEQERLDNTINETEDEEAAASDNLHMEEIKHMLRKDGYYSAGDNLKIWFSPKRMKVNGTKVAEADFQRYKATYERLTGSKKWNFNYVDKNF